MSSPVGTTARWRSAFASFERLAGLDAAAQEQELQRIRDSDPELYPQVLTLLRADREVQSRDFLGRPDAPAALASEQVLGHYRLERRLGEGGMGEVWLARRADGLFEAPVALKLLHAHLGRSSVRERFLREGRILGQLTHANVARLLDAGALPDGRLYLALEYVDGQRLDRWCDEQKLDVRGRVRLFLKICEAVAHAHANGAVHRDLKPSNILVTKDGQVKLLDFGIAKLIEDEQGEAHETELTSLGGRVLTPEYAAPEQMTGSSITAATDVYSLGVVLYVLLSGQRPYGEPGQTAAQIEKEVLDTDPAPLSRAHLRGNVTQTMQQAAELRGTTARKLLESLRGDLDTILGRALKKSPKERYPTATALAEDLQRYLNHEPVLAVPDSLNYRLRRFVRRNRIAVAAATAIFTALTVGLGLALWQAARAIEAREQSESLVSFMLDDLSAKLKPVGRLDIMNSVIERVLGYYAELPLDAQTDDAVAKRMSALQLVSDIQRDQGKAGDSEATLQQALAIGRELMSRRPEVMAYRYRLSHILLSAGRMKQVAQQPDAASAHYLEARDIATALLEHEPANRDYVLVAGAAHNGLGRVAAVRGDNHGALTHFSAAVEVLRANLHDLQDDFETRRQFNRYLTNLHNAHFRTNRYAEATILGVELLKLGRQLIHDDPKNVPLQHDLMLGLINIANSFFRIRKQDEADALNAEAVAIARAVSETDPQNTEWLFHYGWAVFARAELLTDMGRVNDVPRQLVNGRRLSSQISLRKPADSKAKLLQVLILNLEARYRLRWRQDMAAVRRNLDASLATWPPGKDADLYSESKAALLDALLLTWEIAAHDFPVQDRQRVSGLLDDLRKGGAERLTELETRHAYLKGDWATGERFYAEMQKNGMVGEPLRRFYARYSRKIGNH